MLHKLMIDFELLNFRVKNFKCS